MSIAVVIPVRDGARYLAEALTSALGQEPDDVVVVDDGSTDDSAKIAAALGVRVLRQEPQGAGAARNLGVASTSTTNVAFLDADDIWEPNTLSVLLEALRTPMSQGMCAHFASPDLTDEERQRLKVPEGLMPALIPGGLLFTRAALEAVGPFRTDLQVGEFVDWYSRATDLGLASTQVDDLVLHRRIHARNTGTLRKASQADLTRAVRDALARRRAAAT